jgi:RNA polymerase subunit RPABC4/transcription elongation factor Spt4
MRFCNNCKKITAGKPPFCNFCARSYNVKLCPRGHTNPRAANACSICGSTELSTPAPQSGMSTIGYIVGIAILLALVP